MVPNKVFFTKGVGVHKERLASFEMALRAAGVAHCNLVLVSSIYPPGCKIISKEEGLKLLRPGEIVFAVYDRESNNEPNRLVAASVGLAIPSDSSMHGYLSEHHSFGETDERAGNMPKTLPPACSRPPWGLNLIQNWTGTSGRIFLRCQGRSSVRATSLSPLSAIKMGSGRLFSRRQFLSTKITCLLRAESLKGTRLPAMKMRTGTKHQDQFQKLASPQLASLRSQPNTTPPAAT